MSLLEQLPKLLSNVSSEGWQSLDFAALDQLHIGGVAATKKLLEWLPADAIKGLDMGGGLGGCARLLSQEHGCDMVVSDLDEDYIAAGKMLDKALSHPAHCSYVVANSLDLPFDEGSFDFILSQHAMMPIEDKQRLMLGAMRTLKPNGHLLLHEVFISPNTPVESVVYPTPWSSKLEHSHLQGWIEFTEVCHQMGWHIELEENETEQSLLWLQQARAANANRDKPRNPLNPRLALGVDAGIMSANVLHNLEQGLIEVRRARLTLKE